MKFSTRQKVNDLLKESRASTKVAIDQLTILYNNIPETSDGLNDVSVVRLKAILKGVESTLGLVYAEFDGIQSSPIEALYRVIDIKRKSDKEAEFDDEGEGASWEEII